ncbi:MAG: hypothetical protein QXZ20_02905 [Candidatus Aenigmatarchaeota archaeon]
MNKSILLATIAVLLVAGCTQQGQLQWPFQQVTTTTIGGTGLVISDFSADPTNVYSNSNARIMMTVANKGGAPVPDDKSVVFLTGSALKLDDTTGTYWHNSAESVFKHFGKTMNPEDPVRGTPADEKTITWSLTAPNITKGTTRSDIFIGRVYYDYQTTVTGTIWVYSQSESDVARAAGRTLNKATFSSTSGPVALIAKVSPDPVVLATGENSFTMTIKVSNVGGGALYKAGAVTYTPGSEDVTLTTDELNRVNVAINAPGMTVSGCTGEQELVGGKDITLSCDVTIASPPTTFQGYPITITATYGYNTERTASVTVSGR